MEAQKAVENTLSRSARLSAWGLRVMEQSKWLFLSRPPWLNGKFASNGFNQRETERAWRENGALKKG